MDDDEGIIKELEFSICPEGGISPLFDESCVEFSYHFPIDQIKDKANDWEWVDFYKKYTQSAIKLVEDKIANYQHLIDNGTIKEITFSTNVGGDLVCQFGNETILSEMGRHFSKNEREDGRPMMLLAHDWGVLAFDEEEKRRKGGI